MFIGNNFFFFFLRRKGNKLTLCKLVYFKIKNQSIGSNKPYENFCNYLHFRTNQFPFSIMLKDSDLTISQIISWSRQVIT